MPTAMSRLSIRVAPADLAVVDGVRGHLTRAAYLRDLGERLVAAPEANAPELAEALTELAEPLPEDAKARLDARMPRKLRRALRRFAGGRPVGAVVRGAVRADAAGYLRTEAPNLPANVPSVPTPPSEPAGVSSVASMWERSRTQPLTTPSVLNPRLELPTRPQSPAPRAEKQAVRVRVQDAVASEAVTSRLLRRIRAQDRVLLAPSWEPDLKATIKDFLLDEAEGGERVTVVIGVLTDEEGGVERAVGVLRPGAVARDVGAFLRYLRREGSYIVRVHEVESHDRSVSIVEVVLRPE